MSRFMISCGGTGGHLSPGIALAEGLSEHGHQVTLLISQKKVDARLIEKYPHLDFIRLAGSGFGWAPATFCRFIALQSAGFVSSIKWVRKLRPDLVVGFGGFTSAAFIAAGATMRVPVALHEANRVPGRAIRLLGRFAHRVYLPPGVKLESVRASASRHVGLPVRKEFQRQTAQTARAELGLNPDQRVLVVLGGSQGATILNDWARREMPVLAAEGVQLYCVTGLGKSPAETLELKAKNGSKVKAIFSPFCDRMATLLSAADLAVSRAGAGTIAELIRTETPAILVPFPHAADNHQAVNARFFERQGGGLVVDQKLTSQLAREVADVIFNDWLLNKFRSNLERMDRANALEFIVRDLERIVATEQARKLTSRSASLQTT